ncbi:MAG: hypothetical protein ACFFDD_07770 [Promethearchaeota archaeon]
MINWTYTDAVLFTAYDVHRSHDFWLDKVVSSGNTLKEALVELGFPNTNSLVIDTGVFEMEAKKAGISQDLGIDVDIELNNSQIFEAYELSGADFFVSPDEIILSRDRPEIVDRKINIIKNNLLDLLEIVPSSKIIAVIQGHEKRIVDGLLEFYRNNGIEYFAVGGVIPLYHHDKDCLRKHLTYVRNCVKEDWLHIFGLPQLSLLSYYLQDVQVDSVDTSTITYLTARRRYLIGLKPEPVRLAQFKDCDCPGCSVLSKKMSTRSPQFFANLYIHNIVTATRESLKKGTSKNRKLDSPRKKEPKRERTYSKDKKIDSHKEDWMTAEDALRSMN